MSDRRLQAAVLVGLTVATRLPALIAGHAFNADEATLATGGQALVSGGRLYVDVIDRKPPLPFALYGAVFEATGTSDLRWVRLVVVAMVALSGVIVAAEARRRWGTTASWVAGIVLVVGAATLGPLDAPPANFEVIALLAIVVAVVAAARGGIRLAIVAGVALAVAVLCKQPAAVTAVPVAWSLWRHGRVRDVVVGGVSGAVAFLVLAAPFGVADVLEWAVLGTGGYLSMDPADLGVAFVRVIALAVICLGFWAGAWLLVVAPAPETATETGAEAPVIDRPSRSDLDLWLLLGGSLLAVVAGFRFFPHYLIQALPAVALLAGRGAARRPAWVRPALALGVASALVAAALAWQAAATGPPSYETNLADYVTEHLDSPEHVDADPASMPILVWGNVPEIYWRTEHRPAGGFTHTEFLTGYSGGRRHRVADESTIPDDALYREWLQRLRRDPPELILDTAAAGIRGGDDFPMDGFTSFQRFVDRHYEQVDTVDGVPVYRLVNGGGLGPEDGS